MSFPHKSRKRAHDDEEEDESYSSYSSGANSITVVSHDLLSYLEHIGNAIDSKDSPITEADLVSKCLTEITGHETELIFHKAGSRHVEKIFGQSAKSSMLFLQRLQSLKRSLLIDICRSKLGSRVFESLLFALQSVLADDNDPLLMQATDIITEWSTLFCEEWNELSADRFASYCIRAIGRVLCGLSKDTKENRESKRREKEKEAMEKVYVAPECRSNFRMLVSRALDWKLMHEWYSDSQLSLLVQDYIYLDTVASSNFLNDTLLQPCFEQATNDLNSVLLTWKSPNGSRVWEKIIEWSTVENIERIVQLLCQNNLLSLAINKCANFPVQKLLQVAAKSSDETVMDLLSELVPNIDELLITNRKYQVVHSMADLCKERNVMQKDFVKGLAKALSVKKKADVDKRLYLLSLLTLTNAPLLDAEMDFDTKNEQLKTPHSVLVQKLLGFEYENSKRLVDGFANLTQTQILSLASHPSGSHAIDGLFDSAQINENIKTEIILKFTGNWCALASDKYGSRVFDKMWKHMDTKRKSKVAKELCENERILNESKIGFIMYKKYDIETCKESVKKWRDNIIIKQNQLELLKKDLIK